MRVAVIGGGVSGMMAAISCAENGADVVLLEKNEKLGKKLYITGKGRCNVTNNCDVASFMENIVSNKKFLFSALHSFCAEDCINFFEENGCNLKTERGNRVFPVSDKSSDIIKTLNNVLVKNNVKIMLNTNVLAIYKKEDCFYIKCENETLIFDKVVVATGGKSYSSTGSTGDGYTFAKTFSHSIVQPKAALCPIKLKDEYIKSIEGLPLKNVQLYATQNGKVVKSLFGEMLFVKDGISGPIALSMSSFINRTENVHLFLDFKPAITEETLNLRLLREFEENKNAIVFNVIRKLLPKNFCEIFLQRCNISGRQDVNKITLAERNCIIKNLKHFDLNFDCLYNIEYAIITAGGINVAEINPKTMQSKFVDGLYFVGEVLDVDALTGGFNIQIALATAFIVGRNILW